MKQSHWLDRERAFQRDVRDVLATVCVEWYEDRVHHWWSAWLLLWTAIGLATTNRTDAHRDTC